ncbi:MAG TPA: ribosome assembly RNA-binding protein YhbY [Thermoanaerobaculia bacterium]|jgi:RNA-binding protein|nr:ribosome assembly RNA-binding protein YhbY [Thermoanaerobaculia bacterium]
MQELTGAQKKYLRGMAHHLKPVVQVGRNGLTDAVLASIGQALDDHELIKVRLADPQGRKRELAEEIAEKSGGAWVGLVGNVVTLYRRQPDPEKRTIELPG